jgi:hypothetical protein
MKVLRRFSVVIVLTIALAHAALAEEGVIHPGITPPPPPPPSVNGVIHPGSTDPGDQLDNLDNEDATIDLVMETTLSIVRNLLALF